MPVALAYRDQPRRRNPNSRLSPLLTISADARGSAPRLLSLRAEARLRALRLATTTFTYDPNGNVISEVTNEEVMTYAWNADDRLVGIARDAEPIASYLYDATGRRVAATSDAGTTHYLWDEANLLAELDETLATLAQYTDFPGVWGGLSSVHAGGASAFFAPDMSSNIRLLLNAAGGIAEASLYSAFGLRLAGASSQPLRFGGGLGYFDDGLDRLYVRARHYRPGLGAWMSRDPLAGLLGGYGYVGGSPVGWVDPSGWQGVPSLFPSTLGELGDTGRPRSLSQGEVDPGADGDLTAVGKTEDALSTGKGLLELELKDHKRRLERRAATDLRRELDRQAQHHATAEANFAEAKRHRRAAEQGRDRARGGRLSEVRHAAEEYGKADAAYKLAKQALANGCQVAATEAAEGATRVALLRRVLNWLKELLETLRGGIHSVAKFVERLFDALPGLARALDGLGAVMAFNDLMSAWKDYNDCRKRGARCTIIVCGAPVVNSAVDMVASLVTMAAAVPGGQAIAAGAMVVGLLTTGFGYLHHWLYAECFA